MKLCIYARMDVCYPILAYLHVDRACIEPDDSFGVQPKQLKEYFSEFFELRNQSNIFLPGNATNMPRVSLPPNPPPIRLTLTETFEMGISQIRAINFCI